MKKIAWICGVVSILYELVWTRYLGLLMGTSVYAVGTVTGCYMAGMAAGEFFLGKWAQKRPLLCQRILLAGLSVSLLASPVLYHGLLAIAQLPSTSEWALSARTLWRIALSLIALFVPTFCMGAVLPTLTAMECVGGQKIYTVHSLGAIIGAVVTGFFLIKYLGLTKTTAVGAILSAIALGISFRLRPQQEEPDCKKPTVTTQTCDAPHPNQTRILIAYSISGFTGMAFQVYQTRVLTLFFLDSVYDFAIILAVYLSGLWIGNALSSRLADRADDPLGLFGLTQFLLGIASIASLFVIARLPFWTEGSHLQSDLVARYGGQAFLAGILIKVGCTAAVLLLPAILWGMAYPLVYRLCVRDSSQKGRICGTVMGWNTIGSTAGSLGASFVLISLLGIQHAILLNACLNLVAGLLLVNTGKTKRKAIFRARYGVCLLVSLAAGLAAPAWNRFEMSTSFLVPGQDVTDAVDIRYYREDAYGITSVVDFLPYDQTYLTTNRLYCQNTSDMNGPQDHRRLGYMPLLMHPSPKNVLVEGLGAGITLRGVREYGKLAIDCVEISQAVAEAATHFSEENDRVLEAKEVHLVIDDARNYLAQTKKSYDVILADLFFPMSSGSGSMFSREYYETCKDHLADGGYMVQWIPLHQFSSEELDITMKTFSEVFPYTTVWFGMLGDSVPAAGLVGSKTPQTLSLDRLETQYGRDSEMELIETALDDPYMFLSHFVCLIKPEDFEENLSVNTDDRPILEYLNPLDTQSYEVRGKENLKKLLEKKESAVSLLESVTPQQREILEEYDRQIAAFIQRFL